MVFVEIVGVVGVSPQEECGGCLEGLRAGEDVFEGAVGVQAQFAACGLDAVWCSVVGVCPCGGLRDDAVCVFWSEGSFVGAECDGEDLLPPQVAGACPVGVIVVFHAGEETASPVVPEPLVLVIAADQHVSVVGVAVDDECQRELLEIVDAVDGACLLACLGEDRQQHGAQ